MTKEEELRQLEELRRIREEEKRKMQGMSPEDMYDSAFTPDNDYLNDSAFTDSAFTPDNSYVDSAFAQQGIQNPIGQGSYNNGYVNPNPTGYVNQAQQPRQVQQPRQMQQQPRQMQQQPRQVQQQPRQVQQQPRQAQQPRQVQHQQPRQVQQQPRQVQQQPRQAQQQLQMREKGYHNMQSNRPNNDDQPNKQKRKKKKHPLLKFFLTILILLLIVCGAGLFIAMRALNRFDRIESNVSARGDSFTGDTYNILLIGQDAREGQTGQRADSIILCTINKSTHSVTLTSLMRDMYVPIPGYGSNRINAAFAYGGVDLLDQTIEENFGIRIDGNALVDFTGFIESMTAVGDLDIELTAEEAQFMNENPDSGSVNDISDEQWNLHEGVNTLTPNQLLSYSRIRHVGNSDWDRTNRQRKVIMAVVDKVKRGHIIKGIKVLNGVAPHISTDISNKNMLKAALAFIISGGGDMKSFYLPAEGAYSAQNIDGMAVLVPDIAANREILHQYMQGIDPNAGE